MSPLLIAVLALAAPPSEGIEKTAPPRAAVSAEKAQRPFGAGLPTPPEVVARSGDRPQLELPPRTGVKLRQVVRTALRRWARASDAQADAAAREFLTLYKELKADDRLPRSQREYFLDKVRIRLMRLSDQIALRVAREKRLAKSRQSKRADPGDEKAGSLAGPQQPPGGSTGDHAPGRRESGPAFGGGAMQIPDHGQELVELIQTVIRPETWDVNGGPGSIYYWYPGRALVIRQMGEVHEEIGGVLGQMRRAGP